MNPAKRTFTIALADGAVASRTSRNNYTHAVVASALIPDQVRRSTLQRIAEDELHIARLEKALETMDVAVVSRGIRGRAKNLNLEGRVSWTLYTATLKGSGPLDDDRKALSTWCNSEGFCSPAVHAQDQLATYARNKLAVLTKSLEDGRNRLAKLDAGTYDPGTPRVLRWAVGKKAALRAQASGLRSVRGLRSVDIIAVGSVENPPR